MDKKEKTAKALGIVSFVLSILGLKDFRQDSKKS